MKKTRYFSVLMCAVLMAFVLGLGGASAKSADALRVAFTTNARTLDPATVTRD